eukprot:CAMPEP_0185750178 /NCGR_PEP_ID=MMETSP1174-20130828/8915_1 /TAXON_ID=35687 /ORGANISM="Dictyocha speculum, Strain CCMP1381" /LENGTH=299 /DNA_ID=CAMNT_0028426599 /DNA_START=63 /DNA_END=962 /DNA_ORIENTATION=+
MQEGDDGTGGTRRKGGGKVRIMKVGQLVEARYRASSEWFPGEVIAVHSTTTTATKGSLSPGDDNGGHDDESGFACSQTTGPNKKRRRRDSSKMRRYDVMFTVSTRKARVASAVDAVLLRCAKGGECWTEKEADRPDKPVQFSWSTDAERGRRVQQRMLKRLALNSELPEETVTSLLDFPWVGPPKVLEGAEKSFQEWAKAKNVERRKALNEERKEHRSSRKDKQKEKEHFEKKLGYGRWKRLKDRREYFSIQNNRPMTDICYKPQPKQRRTPWCFDAPAEVPTYLAWGGGIGDTSNKSP